MLYGFVVFFFCLFWRCGLEMNKHINNLATWCEELTLWKRPWCWERLKAGGEGNDRGWDGWMASPTQWTWVWASSGSWWWTGGPGVLQSMGSQRVRHDWTAELTDWLIKKQRKNADFRNEMLGKREKKNRIIEGLKASMFVKPLLGVTL